MCERDVSNQIILRSLGDSPSPCNPGLQFLCSWTYGGVSTMQTPQRRHTCWWPVFEETQPLSSRCLQLSWCYLAKQWLRDIAQWCLSREKTLCSLPYFHLRAETEPFSVFLSDSSLGNPCHVMGQNSTSIGPGLTFRHVLLSRSLLGLRRLWLWESEEEDASGRCCGSRMGCTDGLVRCGGWGRQRKKEWCWDFWLSVLLRSWSSPKVRSRTGGGTPEDSTCSLHALSTQSKPTGRWFSRSGKPGMKMYTWGSFNTEMAIEEQQEVLRAKNCTEWHCGAGVSS